MLIALSVRNFVIARDLELEVSPGLTVLSGETGAGKTILLDALMQLAGDRADANLVRHGADKADLSATFQLTPDSAAAQWLQAQDLWEDEVCVVRRVLNADGGSRASINGTSVAVTQLRELGDLLLRIHAQHEHQRLLKPDQHLAVLDAYTNPTSLLASVRTHFQTWQRSQRAMQALAKKLAENQASQELRAYQLSELEALDLQPDELDALVFEQKRLSRAEELLRTAAAAQQLLLNDDDHGDVTGQLGQAVRMLEPLAELDDQLSNALSLLQEALVQLQEANSDLVRFADQLSWDPQRLAEVDTRLDTIYSLARKHHCEAAQLPDRLIELQSQAADAAEDEAELAALELAQSEAAHAYHKAAQTLSEQRQQAAEPLAQALMAQLKRLNMPDAQVECIVQPNPERWTAQGFDSVTLQLSANLGQPIQPLHKAASGGELSRIALALQVIAQHEQQAPTLFFDEVDVGISGATAEEVGRLIRQLSAHSQILCITHLPQVASFGHQHWRVGKRTEGSETLSEVVLLSEQERVEEVARLISGSTVTDSTRAHARDLLAAPLKTSSLV